MTNTTFLEAEIKRGVAHRASSVYLMADNSKLDKEAVISFCQLRDLTAFVTDRRPPDHYMRFSARTASVCCASAPASHYAETAEVFAVLRRRAAEHFAESLDEIAEIFKPNRKRNVHDGHICFPQQTGKLSQSAGNSHAAPKFSPDCP